MIKPNISKAEKVEIGIEEKDKEKIAKNLSVFLASTYTLYIKSLNYHWNIKGRHFHSIHELTEKLYQDLHEAGDEIAERIRALGYLAPGSLKEYLNLSQIKEDDSLPEKYENMLKNLINDNELMVREARKIIEHASGAGDEVTVDLLVGRMSKHEHLAWMFRSFFE